MFSLEEGTRAWGLSPSMAGIGKRKRTIGAREVKGEFGSR